MVLASSTSPWVCFGFSEIIRDLEQSTEERSIVTQKLTGLMPTWVDFKACMGPIGAVR